MFVWMQIDEPAPTRTKPALAFVSPGPTLTFEICGCSPPHGYAVTKPGAVAPVTVTLTATADAPAGTDTVRSRDRPESRVSTSRTGVGSGLSRTAPAVAVGTNTAWRSTITSVGAELATHIVVAADTATTAPAARVDRA